MDNQIKEMAKIIVNELKIDKYWALVISETLVNAGYGDLRAFAERLKASETIKEIVENGYIVSYVELCNKIDEICKEITDKGVQNGN